MGNESPKVQTPESSADAPPRPAEQDFARARSEAALDGRPDRAAARFANVLLNPAYVRNDDERHGALEGLEALAEHPDGRIARRLLVRYYRQQGDTQSVHQIHNLALRLGSATERALTLVERMNAALDAGVPAHAIVRSALDLVDTRKVTDTDIAYALVRAWFGRQYQKDAIALLDLAAEHYTLAQSHDAALMCHLTFLQNSPTTLQPQNPRVPEVAAHVLRSLHLDTPIAAIQHALRLDAFPAIAKRAYTLATQLNLGDDKSGRTPATHRSMRSPRAASHAETTPLDADRLNESLTDAAPPSTVMTPEEDVGDDLLLAADVPLTNNLVVSPAVHKYASPTVATSTPESRTSTRELRRIAREYPTDIPLRYELAQRYQDADEPERELQILGELAVLETAPHTIATLYRRSATLLAELGDMEDALRLRVEAVYLSHLEDDDLDFIDEHVRPQWRDDLASVATRLLTNLSGEDALQMALLAARLYLAEPVDAQHAWDILYPAWVSFPNSLVTLRKLLRIAQLADKDAVLRDAVCSLAAKGLLRDPSVINLLISRATQQSDDECFIALHICAAAAEPLNRFRRRKLEEVLSAFGRSRASGCRHVLSLVHEVGARREWTDIAVRALETEGRFAEAADLLLALYAVHQADDDPFDRALLNLERAHLWPRIVSIIEEELTRPRSPKALVDRLRYLSRVARMQKTASTRSQNAAVRVALAHPNEASLDDHARAELAAGGNAEAMASYLERRAHRLGNTVEAADLYLEAADILSGLDAVDPERLHRLFATARRAGHQVSEIQRRVARRQEAAQRTPSPTHVSTDELPVASSPQDTSEIDTVSLPAKAVRDAIEDARPHSPVVRHDATSPTTPRVDPPPRPVEPDSASSTANDGASRAIMIARYLDADLLARTYEDARTENNRLTAIAATELLQWLHNVSEAERDAHLISAGLGWDATDIQTRVGALFARCGASPSLNARLLTALGDPLDALRARSYLQHRPADTNAGTNTLITGFTASYWLSKYTSLRQQGLHDIVQEPSVAASDRLLLAIDILPWLVGWYGSGSLLSAYRSIAHDFGLYRAYTVDELVTQMTHSPPVALLFEEFAAMCDELPHVHTLVETYDDAAPHS